ncbi:TolC family protein [Bradyrhizobium sp. 149]|uniref:TolC family protein n=1 Tax=Bradyrhizobium sp. 149 TaxID=2782624 RepID=UPI001FFBC995|nr:TolC family protein [Bradyrhizobium sp. 149]MCK1651595.1 TolC family protein [Bradyrhizobium sp. 149]
MGAQLKQRLGVALALALGAAVPLVGATAQDTGSKPAIKAKRVNRPPAPPVTQPAAAETDAAKPAGISLTVADAIAIALRDNRTIRSAYIDRISQKFDLRAVEDRFTPHFSIGGGATHQQIAGIGTTSAEITPAATALLPTGATFGLAWANQMTDTAGVLTRSSAAELTVSQPLLRGGGVDVTMAPVRAARLSERINRLKLKATVSETIGQVIFAYRALLQAQEELKLAQASVGRAQDLVDINRSLIVAGRMAAVDIVQTEADVENQRIRVLEATKTLDTARLQLLNFLSIDLGAAIAARESTDPARIATNLSRLMQIALAQRPDYLGQVLVVEQNKLGIVVAQNERLWDLSVFASGRFGRATTTGGGTFSSERISDVTVGAAFSIPLNDLRREQPFVQATATLQTSELQLTSIRQGVELQVRGSVTDVDIRWRQLEVARRARQLAAKAVEIEKEKLKAGRSVNFQVRGLENDLRLAESQQLAAMIGYLNALTLLDIQLGTTLDTWRIALKD